MEQNRVTGKAVIQPSEQRSEREILELIEEYKKSEFSVKDFCEVSDLNETTFYSWIKKYGSKKKDDVSVQGIIGHYACKSHLLTGGIKKAKAERILNRFFNCAPVYAPGP